MSCTWHTQSYGLQSATRQAKNVQNNYTLFSSNSEAMQHMVPKHGMSEYLNVYYGTSKFQISDGQYFLG